MRIYSWKRKEPVSTIFELSIGKYSVGIYLILVLNNRVFALRLKGYRKVKDGRRRVRI